MKNVVPIFLIAVFLLATFTLLTLSPEKQPRPPRPVKLATSSWKPFVSPHLVEHGPIARVVSETVRRMGYRPELIVSSWDVMAEQVDRLEVLGAFPLIRTRSRDERYVFSDPLVEFEYVLFYYRPRLGEPETVRTAEDLRSRRFGLVRGYEVWPDLAEIIPSFVDFDSAEQAFAALAAGEIDFLPEGRAAGLAMLHSADVPYSADDFEFLTASQNPLFGATVSLRLISAKGRESRDFMTAFNDALAEVKKTTVYREAMARIESYGRERSRVRLSPIDVGTGIRAWEDPRRVPFLRIPAGSGAVVLQWPPGYRSPQAPDATEPPSPVPEYAQVKLLDGPLAGRVVYVDARTLTLQSTSQP